MYKSIEATKYIIDNQIKNKEINHISKSFDTYGKIYAQTNENIDGYMSKLNFNNKDSALCVMASGDHVFNAAMYGIKNIDSFDINKLTEYYALGIKRSAILKFNYQEYINFMNKLFDKATTLEEINDLINLIIPYMDNKYKVYWKQVIDYYKTLNNNTNLFLLLLVDIIKIDGYMTNSYLLNERNYNKLKDCLAKVNITFKGCNCLNLYEEFNNKYDFIFLSNIVDYFYTNFGYYWNYNILNKEEKVLFNLLKDNGLVALNYIFNYFYCTSGKYKEYVINNSSIRKEDLIKEEIITFQSVYGNNIVEDREAGLMTLKKV